MEGAIDEQSDRLEMLKAFDETEAGVKGLLDSGLHKIPHIFVRPVEELAQESTYKKTQIQVPVIDLTGIHDAGGRNRIIEQVRSASESWGFFQVVNHGIPLAVLDGMIAGVREFHEQDLDEKKKYYSRDSKASVKFNSSHDLFTSRTASWRDTLIVLLTDRFHEDELPPSCRNSTAEYAKHVKKLGNSLLGLMSEALGLKPDHLENIECSGGQRLFCHYYPACPNPELAIGITKHSDAGFITVLLQNQIVSCLQVLYQGQWVDIPPTAGGLVINVGNLLQLVSNGKFISNEHRVIASQVGPRISVACFFSGPFDKANKIYGPIKELTSDENPSIYRDVVLGDYFAKFFTTGLDNYRALDYYKMN